MFAGALHLLVGTSLLLAGAHRSDPVEESIRGHAREVSITASGDILTHTSLWESARRQGSGRVAYDFNPNFAGLRSVLNGDVDICHLETPLTAEEPRSYPIFSTPRELAAALKNAGFDGCSTASNHSLDRGRAGIASTLKSLAEAGLRHSGMRSRQEDSSWALYTTPSGVTVAHLSYTFSTNGIPLPKTAPWSVNLIDAERILHAARAAGQLADLVVLSVHWGTEYREDPDSNQLRLARLLTGSGEIDLIIGHHAHVLQRADLVNGVPVLYGMGNLWSGQGPWSDKPRGDIAALVKLRFAVPESGRPRFLGGVFTPTVVNPQHWKVTAAARSGIPARASASERHAERLLGGLLDAATETCC